MSATKDVQLLPDPQLLVMGRGTAKEVEIRISSGDKKTPLLDTTYTCRTRAELDGVIRRLTKARDEVFPEDQAVHP